MVVLVLGEILFDEFPDEKRPGGAPFNFAQHLHRLGQEVHFVSSVGQDENGRELINTVHASGLATDTIQRHPDASTGRVAVTLHGNGIPTYDIIAPVAYDFIDFDVISPKEVPQMVYFGSLIQRTASGRERLQAFLKTLSDSVLRFYDVNFRDGCATADILLPSLRAEQIVDTVGAGDAFAAMLAQCILSGATAEQTLHRCTQLAEFVCTTSGAIPQDETIYQSLRRTN